MCNCVRLPVRFTSIPGLFYVDRYSSILLLLPIYVVNGVCVTVCACLLGLTPGLCQVTCTIACYYCYVVNGIGVTACACPSGSLRSLVYSMWIGIVVYCYCYQSMSLTVYSMCNCVRLPVRFDPWFMPGDMYYYCYLVNGIGVTVGACPSGLIPGLCQVICIIVCYYCYYSM